MSGIHTDPRTKIFVLLICAVAITISPSLYYEGGLVLLIFIYGIASGKPKYSVIAALVYGVLIGIAVLSNLYLTGALRLMFTTFSDFIGKMFHYNTSQSIRNKLIPRNRGLFSRNKFGNMRQKRKFFCKRFL